MYDYDNHIQWKNFKNNLYSYWISNSIKNCGIGFHIQSPVNIKGSKYMSIGSNFFSGDRLRLECWDEFAGVKFSPELRIGDNVAMNFNVHIGCIFKVTIGNNVLFGSNILITDHQHGFIDQRDIPLSPVKRKLWSSGSVKVEDDVWIGENVCIMPNVTIGRGCIIGANSVVTKSFPQYCVIGGIPAKIIKKLN